MVPTGKPMFQEIDARSQGLITSMGTRRRQASMASGDVFAALPRFFTPMD
jgi:hypothetical protein